MSTIINGSGITTPQIDSGIFTSAGIDDNATSTAVTLDSSGNVGIGVTNPDSYDSRAEKLVVGETGDAGITIAGGASSDCRLVFAVTNQTDLSNGSITYDQSSDSMAFETAGTERLRIASSGNVGIGTSNPTHKLDVAGAFGARSGFSSYTSDGLYGATAEPSVIYTPSNGELRFGYRDWGGGHYAPRIGFWQASPNTPANNSIGNNIDGAFTFNVGSNNTERMRIDSAGRVTMPYQPSFRSFATSYNASGVYINWSTSNGGGSGYTYYRNIGNNFNTTTGVFTAPVAGRYLITAMYANDTGVVERNIGWLFYNGASMGEWVESYGPYDNSAGSIVLYLNINDTIKFGTHTAYPYSGIVAGIDLLG